MPVCSMLRTFFGQSFCYHNINSGNIMPPYDHIYLILQWTELKRLPIDWTDVRAQNMLSAFQTSSATFSGQNLQITCHMLTTCSQWHYWGSILCSIIHVFSRLITQTQQQHLVFYPNIIKMLSQATWEWSCFRRILMQRSWFRHDSQAESSMNLDVVMLYGRIGG